jgi:hypothetical protein
MMGSLVAVYRTILGVMEKLFNMQPERLNSQAVGFIAEPSTDSVSKPKAESLDKSDIVEMSDMQSVHVSGGAVDGKLSWSMMDASPGASAQETTNSALETLKAQMHGVEHRIMELVQQQQQLRAEFEHHRLRTSNI